MKQMSRHTYAALAIVLSIVIFVAVNMASDALFTTAKLDLTANGQFTLAQGTRNILANLKEPVTLKFYYSKQVASEYATTADYAKRVRDLLGEYASLSHGNIVVQEIDPEPFTEAEDQAQGAGLTGAPTDSGDTVYFGLVGTNRMDGKEVIAYFAPEREQYLEYDISSLIYRLSTPKKTLVGIVTSLPMEFGPGGMQAAMQGQGAPYVTYQELAQTYQTQMLPPGFTAIPKDMNVLMIAHPSDLSDPQLRAIDQFVLKGGRALVFVDPLSELAQQAGGNPYQPAQTPQSSDLPKLFKAWGIGFNPARVVADRSLAQRVQTRDPMNPSTLYPVWMHLGPDNFDTKDPVTANLQTLNLATAGALRPLKGATTTFAPLVTSSNQASLLDAGVVKATQDPQALMAQVNPTGEKYVIAARISGDAKSAFPDAPVKSGMINVVVMADSDVFDDRFWVHVQTMLGKKVATPFADNGAFVINSIENLSGSGDLISLRTRESSTRPFTVVRKIQEDAQSQFQAKEKALQQHLNETQQRLHELEQGTQAQQGQVGLTPEQQKEVENFRKDLVDTRTQLRDVQHNLRKDIDALGSELALINIALVPVLVALFALVLAAYRRHRRTLAAGI
jgi:ABC-type uncharacterized transport system involved in gliding motility auxiliary subunit